MTVEHFIAGFHSRIDKVADLQLDDKLKGHLLLRASGLDSHTRNIIIGASSGNYNVANITSSLRQAYRSSHKPVSMPSLPPPSMADTSDQRDPRRNADPSDNQRSRQNRNIQDRIRTKQRDAEENSKPTFFAHFSYLDAGSGKVQGAIVDSGACSSVVGKETLDKAMRMLRINNLPDAKQTQSSHRFGTSDEEFHTLFAVSFPFDLEGERKDRVEFNIRFDIGWPTLRSMRANINCEHMNLGLKFNDSFYRVKLLSDSDHVYLPFRSRQKSFYHIASSQATMNSDLPPNFNSSVKNQNPKKNQDSRKCFDPSMLRKLHLQLQHGSHTAMKEWIQAIGEWSPELDTNIEALLLECN